MNENLKIKIEQISETPKTLDLGGCLENKDHNWVYSHSGVDSIPVVLSEGNVHWDVFECKKCNAISTDYYKNTDTAYIESRLIKN